MAYPEIEARLRQLDATSLAPAAAAGPPPEWDRIATEVGVDLPDLVTWLWSRYDGIRFAEGAAYPDPVLGHAVTLGWVLTAQELAEAWEDTRDVLPDDLIPISNDGADNHVCLGLTGEQLPVVLHIHDALADQRLRPLAPSFEGFLLALQRPALPLSG